MHFKYAEMLVIVLHQNMILEDNTRNNELEALVKTKFGQSKNSQL